MTIRRMIPFAMAAVAYFAPALASAQVAKVSTTGSDDASYGYIFPDDLLSTGLFNANDVVLRVRSSTVRRTLIRPRVHFVPELFKSVENI